MSRKHCLLCEGRTYAHVPPCYYCVTRTPNGVAYFDGPECVCNQPMCTDCNGTGERTARVEGQASTRIGTVALNSPEKLLSRLSRMFSEDDNLPENFDAVDLDCILIFTRGNLWSICIQEFRAKSNFECIAGPTSPTDLLAPGTYELYFPYLIGTLQIS